jgi:membrane protein insertase Oxa1/YidC/SpoIIIJ
VSAQTFLEGLCIVSFVWGLQLPQSTLLYWTTNNFFTLLQVPRLFAPH